MKFIRDRSISLSMVVLVLCIIAFLQGSISYTISYGKLDNLVSWLEHGFLPALGIVVRGALIFVVILYWILNRKQQLFKMIIVVNAILTLGLSFNMLTLVDVLRGVATKPLRPLLHSVQPMPCCSPGGQNC